MAKSLKTTHKRIIASGTTVLIVVLAITWFMHENGLPIFWRPIATVATYVNPNYSPGYKGDVRHFAVTQTYTGDIPAAQIYTRNRHVQFEFLGSTNRYLGDVKALYGAANTVAISPSGDIIVARNGKNASLYRVSDDQMLGTVPMRQYSLPVISPDEKLIAFPYWGVNRSHMTESQSKMNARVEGLPYVDTDSGIIAIYSIANERLVARLTCTPGEWLQVAWSADGKTLASLSSGHNITLWSTNSWRVIKTLGEKYNVEDGWIRYVGPDIVAFTCTDRPLNGISYEGSTRLTLIDTVSGKVLASRTANPYTWSSSKDGKRIAFDSHSGIGIIDVRSGQMLYTLSGMHNPALSSDGRLIAGTSRTSQLEVWHLPY